MNITMQTKGLDTVRHLMDSLSEPKLREAYAKAINDTAFVARKAMQDEMGAVFDRPTNYILKSPKVVAATPENTTAYILPTLDTRNLPSKGGKVGVDPQKILRAQAFGGKRHDKKSELAFQRAGILPAGYQTAIPTTPYPGSHDGRGNLRGAFLAQLISYLQAYGEQGYRANMRADKKRAMANKQAIGSIANKRTYQTTLGRRYFVAYGRLRGGVTGHLAPGIYAASGTHGVDIKPVLMFVKPGDYTTRLDTERIAKAADINATLARKLRYRIRQAAGV